eukprot:811312-Prorocentrum_minimum.AAC.1
MHKRTKAFHCTPSEFAGAGRDLAREESPSTRAPGHQRPPGTIDIQGGIALHTHPAWAPSRPRSLVSSSMRSNMFVTRTRAAPPSLRRAAATASATASGAWPLASKSAATAPELKPPFCAFR